eukprot:maker-scaffold_36-snap-gene-0.4-mRNA-1 protein AED:0.19 eAED:0.19 QI:114/1/1/1/1/1/3/209/530
MSLVNTASLFFDEKEAREVHCSILVLGGGVSGGYASRSFVQALKEDPELFKWKKVYSEELRKSGKLEYESFFCGLVSAENIPPYERAVLTKSMLWPGNKNEQFIPKLSIQEWYTPASKNLNSPVKEELQSKEWYKKNQIELFLGFEVVHIEIEDQVVTARNLETRDTLKIHYERLIYATGARPLFTSVFSEDEILDNVFTARDFKDIVKIQKTLVDLYNKKNFLRSTKIRKPKKLKVLIVGGGYLGLEAAIGFSLHKTIEVTLVFMDDYVLPGDFPLEISQWLTRFINEHYDIKIIHRRTVKSFKGKKNSLTHATLETGEKIEADVAVVGIGIVLNTELVKDQLEFDDLSGKMVNAGVAVDRFLRSSDPVVFGAGDVISMPHKRRLERFEHVDFARYSGSIAMFNALVDLFNKKNPDRRKKDLKVAVYENVRFGMFLPLPGQQKFLRVFALVEKDNARMNESFYGNFAAYDLSSKGVLFSNRVGEVTGGILLSPKDAERDRLLEMVKNKEQASEWRKGHKPVFFKDEFDF